MGLLSKLGGAIKEGIRVGVVKGITKSLKQTNEGRLFGVDYDSLFSSNKNSLDPDEFVHNLEGRKLEGVSENALTTDYDELKTKVSGTMIPNPMNEEYEKNKVLSNSHSDVLTVDLPNWGYDSFINERGMWQKQITSAFGDPGFFYFKVFFKFDTQHGLFGGLLNDADFMSSVNSAAKFLFVGKDQYAYLKPIERIDALFKFSSILSYISSSAPWYFTSVTGLDEALVPTLNEFSKERVIEIGIAPDAIDMRLSTLLSLYKFACFDDITNKEIIPENLRKFDMSIVIFAAPIKHLHTSMLANYTDFADLSILNVNSLNSQKSFEYKKMDPERTLNGKWGNVMSFKMITLKNCEFMIDSLGSIIPNNVTNDRPFQLGGTSIKIKYDKAYDYTMNEFYSTMFGSGGMLYNQFTALTNPTYSTVIDPRGKAQAERLKAMQLEIDNARKVSGKNPTTYKPLIDASEALITNRLMNRDNMALGNIYGEDTTVSAGYTSDGNGVLKHNKLNDYYRAKLKYLHNRLNLFSSVGGNILLNLLNSSWTSADTLGNLYGDVGVGSPYWRNKLKKLHNKDHKNSSAGEFYEDYQNVMNFDVRDFLFNTSRGNKGIR